MDESFGTIAHRLRSVSLGTALLLGAGAVCVGLVGWLVYDLAGGGGSPPPVAAGPAPSSVSVPAGLSDSGLQASGISRDGWLAKDAKFTLAGGGAGNLVLRANVPAEKNQHVTVSVDGKRMESREVKPGKLDLRIALPASTSDRTIELNWDRTIRLAAPDNRDAAAQLRYAGIALPPSSIDVPSGLTAAGASYSGIYSDGWLRRNVHVLLAGGPAGRLVIRATIPQGARERVGVSVDGKRLATEVLSPGPADLRVAVPASRGSREITLVWSTSVRLAPPDRRRVTALLQYVGLAEPPASVSLPAGLSDPGLTTTGVYPDGWLRQKATLTLAGGKASKLLINANVPKQPTQTLAVTVNGHSLGSHTVHPGKLDLALPVPASRSSRTVELRWSHAITLAAPDSRRASAQLTRIGLAAAPSSVTVPDGLANPGIDATGIYADGWLRQDAALTLAGGNAGDLVLSANVPQQPTQTLTVGVNGHLLGSHTVHPGKLDLVLPVPASSGPRRIELRWSRTIALAAPDSRHAAAQLVRIGLATPPRSVSTPTGLGAPGVAAAGVYADGWMRRAAALTLAGGKAGTLVLDVDVPSQKGLELTVLVNGRTLLTRPVAPGALDLRVAVPASSGSRRIELRWSQVVHLQPPDTRSAAAQLKRIAIR